MLTLTPKCAHNVYMSRTSNPTAQHFILERNGVTVATDKIGAHAGLGAFSRMLDRLAVAAGTDRLRCTDETGAHFEGGLTLVGPLQSL